MSGGGNEPKTGGMLLSTGASAARKGSAPSAAAEGELTPEMLRSLDASVAKLQKELADVRATKVAAENEMKSIQQRLKSIDFEVGRLKMALKHVDDQTAETTGRLASLRSEGTMTAAETRELKTLEVKRPKVDPLANVHSPPLFPPCRL